MEEDDFRKLLDKVTKSPDPGEEHAFVDSIKKQLSEALTGVDPASFQQYRSLASGIGTLCEKIEEQKENLQKAERTLGYNIFFDAKDLQTQLSDGRDGSSLFLRSHQTLLDFVMPYVQEYKALPNAFFSFIEGRLTPWLEEDDNNDKKREGKHNEEDDDKKGERNEEDNYNKSPNEKQLSVAEAVKCTRDLSHTLNNTFIQMKVTFPDILKNVYQAIATYNQYLQERFIKQDQKPPSQMEQMLMMLGAQIKQQAKYEKIKLIEDNPLLTDVLLEMMEVIPEYKERTVNSGRKKKKIRSLSSFAVTEAADKLIALSDYHLLSYLKEPRKYFSLVGKALEAFQTSFAAFEKSHMQILESPLFRIHGSSQDMIHRVLYGDLGNSSRLIRKIKNADFDNIIQHEDDILPDNKREIEYFKLRDQLLELLYEAMQELGTLYDERKEERAKKIISTAVDLKTEIKETLISFQQRRLRRDKNLDNEFYVGMTGEIGRFCFERKPTPRAKIENVIGASFDQAKRHLNEIIETGDRPRLTQLSAPGGKVKSNILLIGPYGCGKTELARAVCADPKVIGASVSVAGTLTAYMHESVNNVKRIYDAAKDLRIQAREMKTVVVCLDEFDSWFAHGEFGNMSDKDMQQIQNVLQEVLDGMEEYNGIITMAMTNNPKQVPGQIMRRFRYVDIVGQLTQEERAEMLKMYVETTMPHEDLSNEYMRWAKKLEDAPGDVIRKVADEIHFALIPEFIRNYPSKARRMEQVLYKREKENGCLGESDIRYVKRELRKFQMIAPEQVDLSIDYLLKQPPIRKQIDTAKKVYRDAHRIIDALSSGDARSFGMQPRNDVWGR